MHHRATSKALCLPALGRSRRLTSKRMVHSQSLAYMLALVSTRASSFTTHRLSTGRRNLNLHAVQWKPCAQPRFDEFASCTVGPWKPVSSDHASTQYEVEEVMRSCGGAIQGIRELELSLMFPESTLAHERAYHNRADGGFVYADDGSYSAGPEQWDLGRSDNFKEGEGSKFCMASLSFGRNRFWMAANLDSLSAAVDQCTPDSASAVPSAKFLQLSRPTSADATTEFNDQLAPESIEIPNVSWKSVQRVRMPNPSQPWSLARAKWEKTILYNDISSEEFCSKISEQSCIFGWTQVELISGDSDMFGDLVDKGYLVRMLAVSQETNLARTAVRCYCAEGQLKSVAFLKGQVTS
jgi:hypothetical protein